jgi:hypothetical protein
MSGLDNLIAFIDNGGTRSGSERRREEGQRATNRICGLMHLCDSQTSTYH